MAKAGKLAEHDGQALETITKSGNMRKISKLGLRIVAHNLSCIMVLPHHYLGVKEVFSTT